MEKVFVLPELPCADASALAPTADDNWRYMVGQWRKEQARANKLEFALLHVRGLCPATDPGKARDSVWGDWVSSGNTDDVARDWRAEGLWEIAVIIDACLAAPADGPLGGQGGQLRDEHSTVLPTPPSEGGAS